MNSIKYLLLFWLLIHANSILAQKDSLYSRASNSTLREGNIEIISDPRLELLIQKHISSNVSKPLIDGYRIQIFFASGTNSKKLATDTKANFITKYPHVSAHIIYQTPNFKVRIGDFRTKLEATGILNEIKRDFPGAFIVKDEINLPVID
jgi:hypothetical protein